MKEAQGNTEVVRSLKHYGWRAFKISDIGGKFGGAKPCDILACSPKGCYVAIEGKMIKKWQSISYKMLQPSQLTELNGVIKNGGRAFVFIYVRIPNQVNKLVVFNWGSYKLHFISGITTMEMRQEKFGVWLDPLKDEDNKILWPLKSLLSM